MITLFLAAFALGLIYNAMPGAVFAETIRYGVTGGFRLALAVQLGSLTGDVLWAVLGLAGVGLLLQLSWLQMPVGIVGVLYLLYLAWVSWQAANREVVLELPPAEIGLQPDQMQKNESRALKAGMMISLTNPHNLAYWAAIGSALGAVGVQEPRAEHYLVFFLGFMVCALLWCFFCAAMVDWIFRHSNQRWAGITYKVCALAFLFLAVTSLVNLIQAQPI